MSYVTVDELELLTFFEVEPELADKDIPWPYNDFTYRVSLGEYAVTFGITPSYKDITLAVSVNGAELYKFTALSVQDVCYQKDSAGEVLEIKITERDSLLLKLRPAVSIVQTVAAAV